MASETVSKDLREFPKKGNKWPLATAIEVSKGILEFVRNNRLKYGNTFQAKVPGNHLIVICEPEYAKYILQDNNRNYVKSFGYEILKLFLGQGLLTSEGDFWLKQRRLAQPAFHRKRLQVLAEVMADEAAIMASEWKQHDGKVVDVHEEMMALTMKIVAKSLFSTDVSDFIDRVSLAISQLNEFAISRIKAPIKWPTWVPTPRNKEFKRFKKEMDDIVYDMIRKRRASGESLDDLLSMLLEARDEDSGEAMDDLQLRDELMTIFVAGHETTAVAMTWTWYLLSSHPGVVEKLQVELNEVLGDRDATVADIPKLVYTRHVLDEVMRLYPPAWIIGRKALEEDSVDGYQIPQGANLLICPYEIHRREDLWEDPESFKPERFEGEALKDMHRFAYFPFGGGPRLCIGNNFALMEMTLILATLARKYRLTYAGESPLLGDALITLRPETQVPMKIQSV